MRHLNTRYRRQSGFTLFELLLVLVIGGIIFSLAADAVRKYRINDAMATFGGEIGVVSHAVSSFVFDQGPGIPAASTTTYSGIDWLRDTTCGGPFPAGQGFVSCNFNLFEATKYGLSYETTVTNDPVTNIVTATITLTPGTLVLGGVERVDLAGKAMAVAKGRYANSSTRDISDGSLDLYIDYQLDPQTGEMKVVIDNSSNGSDPWLSITGQNAMQADLDMGDGSFDIQNARNVFWTGQPTVNEVANDNQSGLVTESDGSAAVRLNARGGSGSTIEFYRTDSDSDFDVRIYNQQDGELTLEASTGVTVDSPILDLIGTDSQVVADDFYSKQTNKSFNQSVTDVFMANHNDTVPKPTCPSGLNQTIYTAVSRFAGAESENPSTLHNIAAFQARAIDVGSEWRIELDGIVQDEGYIVPPSSLASVLAITKCS